MKRELLKQAADYLRQIDKPLDMDRICHCAIGELREDGEQFAGLHEAHAWNFERISADVFDITRDQANYVFGTTYPKPRSTPSTEVAARIENLLSTETPSTEPAASIENLLSTETPSTEP